MKEAQAPLSNDSSRPAGGPFLQNLDVRVVVFGLQKDRLQVLLVPVHHPSRNKLSQNPPHTADALLPGSRVPFNESLEETAAAVLLQLTGLREAYLEQLYTYGEPSRKVDRVLNQGEQSRSDVDRQGTGERLVTVVYFAMIPAGAAHMQGVSSDKDVCRAKWFPVDDLPPLFLDHAEILVYALRRLRYKLEYTAVGFQLLPEYFSLSELQKVYEMILGEKLDKRNFRRRILQAGIIEETQHLRGGEGRPARLFRYRPDAVAEVKARRLFP